LSLSGVEVARIHGNRTQGQRNQALNGFKNGDYRVLVATDVAARGIHVDGIAHVVNYDLPQVAEDFIHRVGRTGRAGARGTASTFVMRNERAEVRNIEVAMKMRLTRREVPVADLPREEKLTPHPAGRAPSAEQVIPIRRAKASQPAQGGSFARRRRRFGRA
jgi:ATP-dependent RNA helicase RhlE